MSTDALVALGGVALSLTFMTLCLISLTASDGPDSWVRYGGSSTTSRLIVGLVELMFFLQLPSLVLDLRELATWL